MGELIKNVSYFGPDFRFHYGEVEIEGGVIAAMRPYGQKAPKDADLLLPGLVDIHMHGAAGKDFSSGDEDALPAIADLLAQNGTTSFSPALMTLPEDALLRACHNARRFHDSPRESGARLAGVTMEGVFFSKAKKGAQNEKYLQNPDIGMFRRLQAASGGLIGLVCIAPELPGAEEFIREISIEATVSAAHTDCDYEAASRGFEAGITHITHLYNAMRPMHHREPGPIPAAAERENITAELICDGIHVHPAMVRAAYKLFGPARLCLVSDSMAAAGMADGTYMLGSESVIVSGGCARLPNGTLAGSAATLWGCMKKAVEFGIPIADAVQMATSNPARVIGAESGRIGPGRRADMVLASGELEIKKVYIGGRAERG